MAVNDIALFLQERGSDGYIGMLRCEGMVFKTINLVQSIEYRGVLSSAGYYSFYLKNCQPGA